ncbi:MAG: FtsQ-type POTRA domain-containing protein [Pseudomonadota bacterium]
MPKVKGGKKTAPEPEVYGEANQISSVIFGLVMVVAMIVAGAALIGGSLSQAGKRWGGAMDATARSVGLSVNVVEVVGLEHIPATARSVRTAAMIERGENMFRADPHRIRKRIEDTGLVKSVNVYRMWPDTVIIRADAAEATALWYDGEQWAVIDSLGRQMARQNPGDHATLMKTVGEGSPEAVPPLAQALFGQTALISEIALAKRVATRRWDLHMKSGMIVRLPGDEHLKTAIPRLINAEREGKILSRALAAIDLRVDGQMSLTPLAGRTSEGAA